MTVQKRTGTSEKFHVEADLTIRPETVEQRLKALETQMATVVDLLGTLTQEIAPDPFRDAFEIHQKRAAEAERQRVLR